MSESLRPRPITVKKKLQQRPLRPRPKTSGALLRQIKNPSQANDGSDHPSVTADPLLRLAFVCCEFRLDLQRVAYARIPGLASEEDDTWTLVPLVSEEFKEWLTHACFLRYRYVPKPSDFTAAIKTLNAKVRCECRPEPTYFRYAFLGDRIYVDLSNARAQVIEVRASGWRVLNRSPVLFRRPPMAAELPMPEEGGRIEEFRGVLNMAEDEFRLVMGWSLMALRGKGPYPILMLIGPKGASKSTASRLLRTLIDPTLGNPMTTIPNNVRDIAVAAHNNPVLVLNNVTGIKPAVSDALCTMATEGGYLSRSYYTNDKQSALDTHRPIIVNGIWNVTDRDDFLDRCLIVSMEAISQKARRFDDEVYEQFDGMHARVFGALLDGLVATLKNYSAVQLEGKPRMADFSRVCTAAESAFGWEPGSFMKIQIDRLRAQLADSIEASPVGLAIERFMQDRKEPWEGTMAELLSVLKMRGKDLGDLPRTPQALAPILIRAAALLREHGIGWERLPRKATVRTIRIFKIDASPTE